MDLVDERIAIEDVEEVVVFDQEVRLLTERNQYHQGLSLEPLNEIYHARMQVVRDVFDAIKEAGYEIVKKGKK